MLNSLFEESAKLDNVEGLNHEHAETLLDFFDQIQVKLFKFLIFPHLNMSREFKKKYKIVI